MTRSQAWRLIAEAYMRRASGEGNRESQQLSKYGLCRAVEDAKLYNHGINDELAKLMDNEVRTEVRANGGHPYLAPLDWQGAEDEKIENSLNRASLALLFAEINEVDS